MSDYVTQLRQLLAFVQFMKATGPELVEAGLRAAIKEAEGNV